MSRKRSVATAPLLWLGLTATVYAGNIYVITATFPSQSAAQTEAALRGGWALDTDLYPNLTPNTFAVVRGPFPDVQAAGIELKSLRSGGGYPGVYLKDAGKPRLAGNLGSVSSRLRSPIARAGRIRASPGSRTKRFR